MPLPSPLRGCRTAIIFLTRIPVGGSAYRDNDWQWSTAWFPFIGFLIGLILALVCYLLAPLGPWVCAFTAIGLGMLITGGFHEDGLADTADALGGAYNREKLFVILKDSRIGAFGAMALCVSLGLRAALLAGLDQAAPQALILTESLSRLTPIWLMIFMPYVSSDEQAKSRQVARARWIHVLVATGLATMPCSILYMSGYLTVSSCAELVIAGLISGLVCGWRFHRRAGGITGDFLGAVQQISQLAMLAVLLWPEH